MDDHEICEKRLGMTLRGTWTLERLLGVGGMAAVYVGVHKTGRRDAIKILHHEAAREGDMRARFEREAHAMNQLGHPGVVEVRDFNTTEDGAPFLVMELLEGEALSERAKRLGGIAIDELLRLCDELLDVLVVAHARGIIHRDIKLDNLFVLQGGRLKVLDFGIAHMRGGGSLAMKTRLGAKLGTAPYMPPEQVKGLPIDDRADIFAVGATMFRLIAKRRIHEASTEQEILLLMATEPAPSLASVAPDAPPDVALIVDRALAFHREQRYPDAATMQRDIRAARRGERPPYATARLAAGDLPSSAPATSGSAGGSSATPFADMPTVVHGKSMGMDARAAAAPPASPASTADMTPLPAPPGTAAPGATTAPMSPIRGLSARAAEAPETTASLSPPIADLRLALVAAAILFALAIVGAGIFWALGSEPRDVPAPAPAPSASARR